MLGVAVLGAGRIGKIHAGNVALNPRLKLVVVADPVAEAAQNAANEVTFSTAHSTREHYRRRLVAAGVRELMMKLGAT